MVQMIVPDGTMIELDTALGGHVPNLQSGFIGLPVMSQLYDSWVTPNMTRRAAPNVRYNCHGLTFASRRTAVEDYSDVLRIIREDGYRRLSIEDVLPGDAVLYVNDGGEPEHSGIVIQIPGEDLFNPVIVSKWGAIGPEVIHRVYDVQRLGYSTTDLRYYRFP